MSITDELREYADEALKRPDYMAGLTFDLDRIADRIDAEYQKAEDEWRARDGQMWLRGYAECHAELMEGNETLASDLERCGWVRLPKDVDGVPLRVGDEIEYPNGARDTVRFATISPIGWAVNDRGWVPEVIRHHHEPTVEDVLRDFANECLTYATCVDDHEVTDAIELYAAKLRLAGDDE